MYEIVKENIEVDLDSVFDKINYKICFCVILPIIIAFKIKDQNSYNECLYTEKTDNLEEALIYLKDNLEKKYGNWLKTICNVGKDDDEIEKILEEYKKIKNEGMYKQLFHNCIKMTLE